MALASHPDPVRSKLNPNLLAKRVIASLMRDLREPFGCLRTAPEGAAACAVPSGAAVREPGHNGTRSPLGGVA